MAADESNPSQISDTVIQCELKSRGGFHPASQVGRAMALAQEHCLVWVLVEGFPKRALICERPG